MLPDLAEPGRYYLDEAVLDEWEARMRMRLLVLAIVVTVLALGFFAYARLAR